MISIIICALNEEHYLPKLLKSLAAQNQPPPYEVLVIDGGSTDGTQAVVETFRQAQTFDIRLLAAPVRGVAAQRNYGASVAQHDLLLFLDADVVLPPNFLWAAVTQITEKNILVAGTKLYAAESYWGFRLSYYLFSTFYLPFTRLFNPIIHGCAIFSTQSMHQYVGGFSTEVIFEDYLYAAKAATVYRPPLLKGDAYIYTSARRFYNFPVRMVWELVRASLRSFRQSGIDPSQMPTYQQTTGKHGKPRY
jgi:glycosyltransferase involved in cell wall biosynthesis